MRELSSLVVAIDLVEPSKSNPRRIPVDPKRFDELVESVRRLGVIQPIVVRHVRNGPEYELICGEQRLKASKAAGLPGIPARVVDATDDEVLEIQLVENLQRNDMHPLDEAKGYQALLRPTKGTDVAAVAAKVGRSTSYVYDRLKLLGLVDELQAVFLAGEITAGHAVILARLSPEDQKRCLGDPDADRAADVHGGLFVDERTLWDPYDDNDDDLREPPRGKAVSVKELQAWVDKNVRFRADAVSADPMLFPETDLALQTAFEQKTKVIPITHDSYLEPHTREGRTWGPRSWKRADGKHGSKECEHAVLGVVAVGPGRGEAFDVCVAKEKCKTHWAAEQREKAKRAKQTATSGASGKDRWEQQRAREDAARAKREAEDKRWMKAMPEVLAAIAGRVAGEPIKPGGPFDEVLFEEFSGSKKPLVPRGSTAEDLVRHCVMNHVEMHLGHRWNVAEQAARLATQFGVDAKKIVDQVAPPEKPPAPAKAEKPKQTPAKTKAKARAKKAAKRKTA